MSELRLVNVPMQGTATITPPTPSTIGHKRRRSSSSARSSATLDVDSDTDSGSKAFAALDRLIELSPEENDVPIPVVAVVGGQSVGKSSLLSMLCDLPLWCAERTSTFGPTHIHSRRRPGSEFTATVHIQLAEVGGAKGGFLFTQVSLTTKDKLSTVLQMAGNEARRVGDGKGIVMRTYEELCLLREGGLAARLEDSTGWPALTNNTVQLMVSGPSQPDISIVDLPGLVSGDGAMISRRLAEKYLAKPGNLILLCLPAGGADPTTDSPETSLVLKHDKELRRTMIVVTKPDHIGDPTRSAWGDLIANQNKGFKYHPALGVHPVRARTCLEYDDGMSTEEIIATGDDLFSGPKWMALAEACGGREFGWRSTSNAIYSKYEKLVKDNMPKLEQRIRDQIQAVQLEESKLPPRIEQPVEKLHRVIAAIDFEIKQRIGGVHDLGKAFHERTRRFRKDLVDTIPMFVAVCKDDEHRLVDVDFDEPEFPRWYQRSNDVPASKIFLDDLQAKLHEHPRAHNGVLPHAARATLVKEYVAPWRGLCEEFNNDVWKILDGLVDAAVRSACVDMPEAADNALTSLREPQLQRVHAFISERIDAELAKVVSYNDDKIRDIGAVYVHRMSVFKEVYEPAWDDAAFSFFEPAMPAVDTPPAQWPRTYADLVIRFAVTADWHIHESGRRITEDMEHALPDAILGGFLPQVATQLRHKFGLLNVRDCVAKRAARLCEPNEDIVEQRAALAKRRKTLEDLQLVPSSSPVDARMVLEPQRSK